MWSPAIEELGNDILDAPSYKFDKHLKCAKREYFCGDQ